MVSENTQIPDATSIENIESAFTGQARINHKRDVIKWLLGMISGQASIMSEKHVRTINDPADQYRYQAPSYVYRYGRPLPSDRGRVFHLEMKGGRHNGLVSRMAIWGGFNMAPIEYNRDPSAVEYTPDTMPKEAVEELYASLPGLIDDIDQTWPGIKKAVEYYQEASRR